MDPQKNTILPKENATVEWVLCSPHSDDIILIAPEGLNDLPNGKQYHEIPLNRSRSNILIMDVISKRQTQLTKNTTSFSFGK